MTISTLGVGAAVTPTVVKTYVSHYTQRKLNREKPTEHISYDEGIHLIRSFLEYASHHTVEELQAFTAQWVPCPSWIRTEDVDIPEQYIKKAADTLIAELGPDGVEAVGGTRWWQWRRAKSDLKAEWIEMKSDHNARVKANERCKRVMLYVHGGAYFFGSVDEHRYQMQRHARKLQARVFAPRYRLAPQFPFPCGLLDCLAAYLYLLTVQEPSEIIVAGDSAGGGMVMSVLCTLRDRGLPLPAGAILLSPWVDLTHSFPSLASDGRLDYIPAHGFMQKPSISWPPPDDDELRVTPEVGASAEADRHSAGQAPGRTAESAEAEVEPGLATTDAHRTLKAQAAGTPNGSDGVPDLETRGGSTMHESKQLSIEIDGKLVILKDQIQMYAPNHLLAHPLVSPILQPSLGGLPPLLIQVGGGELLRDEQLYLGHKAANPTAYPLGVKWKQHYDPEDKILNRYRPTPVQIQLWDDLCHVAPTLSFTKPAKYMYRSVAQFGAWALARAQKVSIEILIDDQISETSESSGDLENSEKSNRRVKQARIEKIAPGQIGKAGDILPPFKHNMIRQVVDRNGAVYAMPPASEYEALRLSPDEIGAIKAGPVRKWIAAKEEWDTKYAKVKRKVQKQREQDLMAGGGISFGAGERPPPSALAGRRKEEDVMMTTKQKKSWGLGLWSSWGWKHDERSMKREEEALDRETEEQKANGNVNDVDGGLGEDEALGLKKRGSRSRRMSGSRVSRPSRATNASRSRSRRRTITVHDQGQAEGGQNTSAIDDDDGDDDVSESSSHQQQGAVSAGSTGADFLSLSFVPRNKLLENVKDPAETMSTRTARSQNMMDDNASTMAVFSAPGVTKKKGLDGNGSTTPMIVSDDGTVIRKVKDFDTHSGFDTPVSRRSMERLQYQQEDIESTDDQISHALRMHAIRSSSSQAIVQAEGVIDSVGEDYVDDDDDSMGRIQEGGAYDDHEPLRESSAVSPAIKTDNQPTPKFQAGAGNPARPSLYDRQDTEFKTALEKL